MTKKTADPNPTAGWSDRVAFSGGPDGFAFRPGEVVVGGGEQGVDVARRHFGELGDPEPVTHGGRTRRGPAQVARLRGDIDPLEVVHELRLGGVAAQPNHVLFAHSCECCEPHPSQRWRASVSGSPFYGSSVSGSPFYGSSVHGSPFYGSSLSGSPFYGSSVSGSPFYGSPFYGSPFYGSPFVATEVQATGRRRSSAVPASGPVLEPRPLPAHGGTPRVAILDTGLAGSTFCPAALTAVACDAQDREVPDADSDRWLDPCAGHGTFIAGLIEQLAPGCKLTVRRVLSSYGDGDEVAVSAAIDALAGQVDILNLSFGGFAMEHMRVLSAAVRRVQRAGAVVVASAGNEATCRPTYPAALPGVIGVGAIGPDGPAPFSNFGPWVRACAPGVALVSSFFKDFDGDAPPVGGADPDRFVSWAAWSGTSFATPVVVAALAREMACYGLTAAKAVERVVDAPGLLRIPGLGTVVNLQ